MKTETKVDIKLELGIAWKQRAKLWAEGAKLRAEGDKLWAEGAKLRAEGDKLWAEGDKLWAEKILELCGNIILEWTRIKNDDYSCELGNGMKFESNES